MNQYYNFRNNSSKDTKTVIEALALQNRLLTFGICKILFELCLSFTDNPFVFFYSKPRCGFRNENKCQGGIRNLWT